MQHCTLWSAGGLTSYRYSLSCVCCVHSGFTWACKQLVKEKDQIYTLHFRDRTSHSCMWRLNRLWIWVLWALKMEQLGMNGSRCSCSAPDISLYLMFQRRSRKEYLQSSQGILLVEMFHSIISAVVKAESVIKEICLEILFGDYGESVIQYRRFGCNAKDNVQHQSGKGLNISNSSGLQMILCWEIRYIWFQFCSYKEQKSMCEPYSFLSFFYPPTTVSCQLYSSLNRYK